MRIQRRRAIVLILVLVVVSLLTLAALTLSELMIAERRASQMTGQQAQARALAESAVEMARHWLDQDAATQNQSGGWYDNAQQFCGVLVMDATDPKDRGRFSIIAPRNDDPADAQVRYGLSDESARINLATVLALDQKTPGAGYQILQNLPGMTQNISDAILDWLDSTTTTPRPNGAKAEYYGTLPTPYAPRNGIPDGIEELLLVRDVTPALLFGFDTNRNGTLDADEPTDDSSLQGVDNSDGSMNCGWARYLTFSSAESNLQSAGTPKINLNQDDLQGLYNALSSALGAQQATAIVEYRLYGPGGTVPASGPDLTKSGGTKFQSVLDLVGVQMSVQSGRGKPQRQPAVFPSDTTSMGTYLPKLQDTCTTTSATSIPGRININQARQTVLQCIPGLTTDVVQQILDQRTLDPTNANADRKYATWLLTEGLVSLQMMKTLMPLVCGGGSVYRARAVGYFESGLPAARLEALIDATQTPARIVSLKDMTRLGSGYPLEVLSGGTVSR